MKLTHNQVVRLGTATVVVAGLSAVMTYLLYGSGALFSLKGVVGVVAQTLIFAVAMWTVLRAKNPD